MKIKTLFLLIYISLSATLAAQPGGTVRVGSNDISFGSESTVTVNPSNIIVNMSLETSTEQENQMLSEHISKQADIFAALDAIGATYRGQTESEFNTRKNTSFVRRKETFTIESEISAIVLTDKQLTALAELIDETDEISYQGHEINYDAEDSIEEIQRRVIDGLLSQSQKYQAEQNTRLTPKGISKMDIANEAFGDEIVSELLEDNDLPGDLIISAEGIKLMGIKHQISAELAFR